MNKPNKSSIRLDATGVASILKRMNDRADSGKKGIARHNRRYDYEVLALVEFTRNEESFSDVVPCRNLSREGIGFLVGRFVYPGTICRVRLVSEFNHSHVFDGSVVRCRYVEGTPGIHEVGVKFAQAIDIAMFHRNASNVRILLVDVDRPERELLAGMLRRGGAEVHLADSPAAAQPIAKSGSCDMIVVNYDAQALAPCDFVRSLREDGHARPISCLSVKPLEQIQATCTNTQCSGCKPVQLCPSTIVELVNSAKAEPLLSTLPASSDMAAIVNQFVFSLADRVVELEKLFAAKDYAAVAGSATQLSAFGTTCGFEPISETATRLIALTQVDPVDPVAIREALAALIRLCVAARPSATADAHSK